MDYQLEELSPVKRKVNVQVLAEEVDAALSGMIAQIAREADMKGFRKGKVPLDLVENRFRKQIYTEATNELINRHVGEIMRALDLKPVSNIDLDGKEVAKGQAFNYSLTFEVLPVFEFPVYEGVEVKQAIPQVATAEIDAVVARIRDNMSTAVVLTEERQPQDGEIAVISFKAWDEQGNAIESVQADNFELLLGAGQSLPEFEAIVKRLKQGETAKEPITLPLDFPNVDLAGRTPVMEITLHTVKVKIMPEVDDEFAKKVGGFESLQDLRGAIADTHMTRRREMAQSDAQSRLLDSLVEKVEYPLPDVLVQRSLDTIVGDLLGRLERQGQTLESLGKTLEQIREDHRADAEKVARSQVFLLALAAKENLSVSDQELDRYFTQVSERTGEDVQQLRRFYEENNLLISLKDRLLGDKALDFLYSKAQVIEAPVAELAQEAQAKAAEAQAAKQDEA